MKRVALFGYGNCGKDTAGQALVRRGYTRSCFGDIIKRQVDGLVRHYFGFSAFTEVDEEKQKIRPLLESWGDVNYWGIFHEYFSDLPELCVNTRLCRVREAEEWKRRGGTILEIFRPGHGPVTPWEAKIGEDLLAAQLIDGIILNDGTIADLEQRIVSRCVNGD